MEVQHALSEHKEIPTIFQRKQSYPGLSLCLQIPPISAQEIKLDEYVSKALLLRQDSFESNPKKVEQEIEIVEEEIDWWNAPRLDQRHANSEYQICQKANSKPKIAPRSVSQIYRNQLQKPVANVSKPSEKSNKCN